MKLIKNKLFVYISCIMMWVACSENYSYFTVREETINETVYASGKILPDPYQFIQTASNEIINHLCAGIGDYVKAGDTVAILGGSENIAVISVIRQQLENIKAAENTNSPILTELQQKIDAAWNKYNTDKKNAERYSALAESKAVSRKDAEYYTLQAETSRIEYYKAQKQHEAKINELAGERLRIENLLAQANDAMEGKIVRAKIDGKVLSVPKKEGETVNPADIIMLIGNDNCFQINLIIDERDIQKVKTGQKIVFETDAYPNQIFYGTVRYVDSLINNEFRSFNAEASIEGETFFYPQSTIEANIITREKDKVLLIPSGYLFPGDSVLIQQGNNAKMVKVVTGIRTGGKIEIKDGIKAGDILLKDKK